MYYFDYEERFDFKNQIYWAVIVNTTLFHTTQMSQISSYLNSISDPLKGAVFPNILQASLRPHFYLLRPLYHPTLLRLALNIMEMTLEYHFISFQSTLDSLSMVARPRH